ncbi:S1/P1 nuclease [Granulicella arctica]|uniref:S1/P1 nuclease n=1 Tax=Granulicella arctica TaxID=940613 RepID=UPI0021E03328|nr:S1/P1 nuclease [Granulicella arctica]
MRTSRHHGFRLTTAAVLLVFTATPHGAWGWGKTGHAVVADIAEAHLTPKAEVEIRRLLAVEGAHHMADIASWADDAKRDQLPGSPSHTIRLPIDGSAAGPHPCPGHFCADDALTRYGAELADTSLPDAQREIALKYIVHLVGDLHQPLHGTNATGQMPVVFRGKTMSLHAMWDNGIIDVHGGSAEKIASAVMKTEHVMPPQGAPIDWALEDLYIAQHNIYNEVPLNPTTPVILGLDYATEKWPIVELRLNEGGLRLADLLNRLIG